MCGYTKLRLFKMIFCHNGQARYKVFFLLLKVKSKHDLFVIIENRRKRMFFSPQT
jgi:hypothetical protein